MFTGFRSGQSSLPEAAPGQVTIMSQTPAATFSAWPTLPQPTTTPPPFGSAGDGDFHILPFPMPGDGPHILPFPGPGDSIPGSTPPSIGLPERVAGTEGNDRIEVAAGAVAAGLGGDDVFVLSAGDAAKAGQPLAVITDFNEGDSLDLSQLGPDARILGRESPDRPWGSERVSIDFNGDGSEDGFVLLAGRAPDLGAYQPYPMPTVPGDGVRPLFTGAMGGPTSGDGAAGIRLMGGFAPVDGLDLSVV